MSAADMEDREKAARAVAEALRASAAFSEVHDIDDGDVVFTFGGQLFMLGVELN